MSHSFLCHQKKNGYSLYFSTLVVPTLANGLARVNA